VELKGSIRNFPLPDVIQFIGSARRTGLLLVTLADAATDERNFVCEWMGAIMEAARVTDESDKGDGDGDGDGFDGLEDLESGGAIPATKAPPRPVWDAAPVKALMRAALRESFGRRARKIEHELEKCPSTKLGLLDFCTKAEKFSYVFIDTARARPVAERLRTIVEEPLP